jgi:NitT/TauT family transport system substrate-binding protein
VRPKRFYEIVFLSLGVPLMVVGIGWLAHDNLLGPQSVKSGISAAVTTTPSAVVRLRLKWLHQGQFAGFYVADKLGYYRAENIKVEIHPGGQNLNPIALVANQTDQIGIAGAEPLMRAQSQKIKLIAIGVVYQESAACFVVRSDSNIKSFKDFKGKTVGTQNGTDMECLYKALAEAAKFDRFTVKKEINVGFNFSRFLNGEVDVFPSYVVNEPWTAKENGVTIRVLSPRDYGLGGNMPWAILRRPPAFVASMRRRPALSRTDL